VRNFAGTVLAGIICAGWFAFGEGHAANAGDEETNQVAPGTLNPEAEKISQASALYASALDRASNGDRPGAIAQLRQVIALEPDFTDAQVKLASLLLDAGQPDAAYAELQAATARHADPDAVKVVLARVEQARGHGAEAQRLAEAALKHDPASTEAMRVLMELGESRHKLEASTARVTQLLQSIHAPVDSYLALVTLYLDITGKENPQPDGNLVLRTLRGIYLAAVKQGPATVDLLSVLSDTYSQLNQPADALKTLQQAQTIDPDNVDIIMRSASLAADAGDSDDKVREYEKAYALEPQRAGLRANLASAYFEDQKYPQAFALMKKMADDSPDDSMLLIRLAVTSETLGHDKAESHAYYEQALRSPALTLEAALKLSAFFIDQRRPAEAAEALAICLPRFPDSAQLHFYDAVQKFGAGDSAAALAEFNQARKLTGDDPSSMGVDFYVEGALILAANNRHGDVEPLLRDGLKRIPDDPNILNEEAWEWADQGKNLDEALTTAKKAVALSPGNGSMLDTLGVVELRMKKSAKALPVLQQAAQLTENDPSVLQHLGDAYLAEGRKSDALGAWKLALGKDPQNHDLIQRIETNFPSAPHATPHPASP
jgi:tetratricopeptide (TPR) repeat protein